MEIEMIWEKIFWWIGWRYSTNRRNSFKPSKSIGIVANNTKYGFYLLNEQSKIKLSSKSILWIKISDV